MGFNTYPYITPVTSDMIKARAVGLLGQDSVTLHQQTGHRDDMKTALSENFAASVAYVSVDVRWDFVQKQENLVFYSDDKGGAQYPSDCLQILAVGNCLDCCGRVVNKGWDFRENRIYPCCGCIIRYIFYNEDWSVWLPHAIDMIVYRLAINIINIINGDKSGTEGAMLMRKYDEIRRYALNATKRHTRAYR